MRFTKTLLLINFILLCGTVSAFNVDQNIFMDEHQNILTIVTANCNQDPLNPTNYPQGTIIDYITYLCFGKNCQKIQEHNLLNETGCTPKTTQTETAPPKAFEQTSVITIAKPHSENKYDYQKITIKQKSVPQQGTTSQAGIESPTNYFLWIGIVIVVIGVALYWTKTWWSYIVLVTGALIIVMSLLPI